MAARKGPSIGAIVVFVLIAAAMAGFGSTQLRGVRDSLGTVGGLDLSMQNYANALRDQVGRIQQQTGQAVTTAQLVEDGTDRAVLAALVGQRALDAEAARLRLSVGDARVRDAVMGVPAFQGVAGFDREAYREALRREGLDERSFETSLREESARTLLRAAVVGALPEPTVAADALLRYNAERRTVTWAPVAADAADPAAPSEADLRAFWEANPALFTAPELRRLRYAWLTPEMIQGSLSVDDQALRDLYEQRRDVYVQEERRLVERLAFPDEAAAQAARARLDAGEATFEELVAAQGLQLSDIDLGDVTRDALGAAGDAAFGAAVGEVVGPVATDLGPALVRVNAVLAADETTFEEAEPDLRAELQNQRARRVIGDQVAAVEDLLAGGATLDDLAGRTDLELGAMDWSEGVTDGIAAYEAFRAAAAAAAEGDFPEVVELEDGGIFVLQLDGITPPALRPFEEAEADVRAAWAADAAAKATLARAEAAAEAVAGGATFESQGLAPQTEPPLTRADPVEGTPPDFLEAAFGMEVGQARALAGGAGAVVLRLDAVAEPDPADEGVVAQRGMLLSQLSQSLASDVLQGFETALQATTEVRLDEAARQAVLAQMR